MIVQNIKKKYGNKDVLKDISFSAEPGECIGILGGNGCGKSTLFNILSGVCRGDGGKFMYDKHDLLANEKLRSRIVGYVPQNTPLLDELTAYDNLRLWYEKKDMLRSLEGGVLDMLGINDFLKVPVCKMSGGMRKRLSIGCSVAHNPEMLLLDEPSAALDLVCKESISDYLKKYKEAGGIVLLATHDTGELPLCDKIYILKNGVLEQFEYDGNVRGLVDRL